MKIKINKIIKILFVFLCFFIMYKISAEGINGTLDFTYEKTTCAELVGPNLLKVIRLGISVLRIAGAIIAIVSGMLALVPAVASDDASALKKAYKKVIMLMIILVCIGIFPTIVKIIGKVSGFDLSCL